MKKLTSTSIEGKNYGNSTLKSQIRKGLKVKINKKTFEIVGYTNKKIPLRYFNSLSSHLYHIKEELKKEGRLTNLFGEKLM